MSDRKKVIAGLKMLVDRKNDDTCEGLKCCKIAEDALAMLKEQEAVEPTLIREGRNKNYNDYVCPRCDNEVVYEQNYCSECGVPFSWKGR